MAEQPDTHDEAGLWGAHRIVFDALASTNQWALDHMQDLDHGTVVQAIRQTAGRGRLGRHWIAPQDRGLAVSAVIRKLPEDVAPTAFTQASAIAVCRALDAYGLSCLLKWPNDVFVRDYKICGILAEADPGGSGIVVGIGLNVNLTDADFACTVLDQPATSMSLERGDVYDVADVCGNVVARLQEQFDRVMAGDVAGLLDDWAGRDWLRGFSVRVSSGGESLQGRYDGLTADGRLRLIDSAGEAHNIIAGDIERLMPTRESSGETGTQTLP